MCAVAFSNIPRAIVSSAWLLALGRHLELRSQLRILLRRYHTHCSQIEQQLALERTPQRLAVLACRARRHQASALLRRERLRALHQLLELREPESFTNSVRLVGPQKFSDPPGHF